MSEFSESTSPQLSPLHSVAPDWAALFSQLIARLRSERTTWSWIIFEAAMVLWLFTAAKFEVPFVLLLVVSAALWAAALFWKRRLSRWIPCLRSLAQRVEKFDPKLQGRLLTAVDSCTQADLNFLQSKLMGEVSVLAQAGCWKKACRFGDSSARE